MYEILEMVLNEYENLFHINYSESKTNLNEYVWSALLQLASYFKKSQSNSDFLIEFPIEVEKITKKLQEFIIDTIGAEEIVLIFKPKEYNIQLIAFKNIRNPIKVHPLLQELHKDLENTLTGSVVRFENRLLVILAILLEVFTQEEKAISTINQFIVQQSFLYNNKRGQLGSVH